MVYLNAKKELKIPQRQTLRRKAFDTKCPKKINEEEENESSSPHFISRETPPSPQANSKCLEKKQRRKNDSKCLLL